jgi:PAS domain S-box-containing protein
MARESAARLLQSNGETSLSGIVARTDPQIHRSIGLLELTTNHKVLFANPNARRIAGLPSDASLSLPEIIDLNGDDLFALVQAGGDSREFEVELIRRDGRRIPVAITVSQKDTFPKPGGNLILTIRSLVEERVTAAIRERIRSSKTANEIFRVMADEVHRWVPFVHCGASIYTENLTQAQTVFSAGPIAIAWPNRWFDLGTKQADWLREAKKGPIPDLQKFQQDPRWRAAIDADTAQAMSALKSAFRIPVVRDNRVAGSVNFFRDQKDAFNDEFELELLRNLPIDNVFLIALSYLDNEELRFQMELTKQLADRSSPEILDNAAAEMIVNRLAQHYGWDAITICRVNRRTQCYELQATGGKKSALIDPNFSQKIDAGVMGEAYRKGEPVHVKDIVRSEQYARLFVNKHKIRMQSELCIPIRAGSEIVAMLNIEDSRRNAFAKTEVETITDLLKTVESMVERQKDATIITAAFEWAPSALFVTAANGAIEKANSAALKMLGYQKEENLAGKLLSEVMEPAEIVGKLLHGSAFRDDMRLVRKDKKRIKVNVASSPIGAMLGAIVTAKDVRSQQRIEELEGLERIFSDIAAQTKVPLALAFSELTRLKRQFEAVGSPQYGKIAEDLDKICRHLRRAEITYDHLALYDHAAPAGLPTNPVIVEAGKLLDTLINELPSSDAQRIRVTGDGFTSRIMADVYQVSWVVLSLLSYGLRLLPESKKLEIAVNLRKKHGKQWVRFTIATFVPTSAQPAKRKSDIFIAKAISDLSLGRQAVNAFARANGGHFESPKKLQGAVELTVEFPVTHIAG